MAKKNYMALDDVQSLWNDKLKTWINQNKADKDADSVADNLAKFDANGNPVDSGIASEDVAKNDEYYKDLHAGLADNLFGETQTNDIFTFRPTAGIQDIESGEPPLGGASVKRIEGNAVAWNQMVAYNTSYDYEMTGIRVTSVGNGSYSFTGTASDIDTNHWFFGLWSEDAPKIFDINTSHFYYIREVGVFCGRFPVFGTIPAVGEALIGQPLDSCNYVSGVRAPGAVLNQTYNTRITPMLIDLTLLFGSGNEPSTVAEFESWLERNIGKKDYYPYNAGELIPVKDFKVKSVGFNAWDEEWVHGYVEIETGNVIPLSNNTIASKNLIPVISSQSYCICCSPDELYITFYGKNKEVVDQISLITTTFVVPEEATFLRFHKDNYGTTYNNDICISLYYDDDKDGTYEEHWEHETAIDVTKIYGKLNGQGEYVQVFPDGIRKAGTSKDVLDLKNGVATVNISKKTLQASNFISDGLSGGTHVQRVMTDDLFSDMKKTSTQGVVLSNVQTSKIGGIYVSFDGYWIQEGYIAFFENRMYVSITGYNTVASIGAICPFDVVYELATPLTYTDLVFRNNGVDTTVSEIKYAVDDYGTEELLLGNDTEVVSVAPTMTIKYGINAADTVASLPHNYVSSKYQSLNDYEKKTARNNIGAASQKDMIVVKKQLELIDKKVENDYYVDMGLPSGLLWAKRNIDLSQADKFAPSEYSYDASFFSWGNTDGHNPTGTTFDYDFGTSNDGPYASTPGAKLTGNISTSYDAAHVNLGEPWRMPTVEEIVELFDNCDFIDANGDVIPSTTTNKLVTMSGVVGIRLKSKINGRILFLPCSGNGNGTSLGNRGSYGVYQSSSFSSASLALVLSFNSGGVSPQDSNYRYVGFVIRPVM